MVQSQNETYTLKIKALKRTLLVRKMERNTGFDLFEKIHGVYASEIPPPGRAEFVIQLYRDYSAMSTQVLLLELYIYDGKLQDLVQYCQPKLL